MELIMPYRNLNHALKLFKGQVSESIPYAIENFPSLSSPRAVFNYLKPRTTYKKDPKGVELFQSLPTLMDDNFHGITGAGDCDCFTIATLATLMANGFTDCGIVLVGRNPAPFPPVHIYSYVNDPDGERHYLDLTNGTYDYERFYPYKQHIPYKLTKEENMMLQLADGGQQQAGYIYFPDKRVQVREDYFDNMSPATFQHMLLEEGIEVEQIEELSSRRSDRRARKDAKKADKREFKKQKRSAKVANKAAKGQKKLIKAESKADSRRIKSEGKADKKRSAGQAKIDRANRPGGFNPADIFKSTLPDSADYDEREEEYEEAQGPSLVDLVPDEQPGFDPMPSEEIIVEDMPMEEIGTGGALLVGLGLAVGGYYLGKAIKKRRYRRAA